MHFNGLFHYLKRPSTHRRIPRRKHCFKTRLPPVYTLSCKSWPHKIQPVSINLLFFPRVFLFHIFFLSVFGDNTSQTSNVTYMYRNQALLPPEGHFLSKRTEGFFSLQFFQDFHFEVIWACFFPLPANLMARKWSLL